MIFALKKNIEQANLLNKELVYLENINALDRLKFNKHPLSKGLLAMNFNQLVLEITRPVSGTCLDHIYIETIPIGSKVLFALLSDLLIIYLCLR